MNLCGLPPAVASWSLALIGLANIAGSLIAGACTQRFPQQIHSRDDVRLARAADRLVPDRAEDGVDVLCLRRGPRPHVARYDPPTATLVGKLFGIRYLATLFGLAILTHQIGGFLGAYLGGIALAHFGDYQWMWYADIALSAGAALINLPIREAPIEPVPVAA